MSYVIRTKRIFCWSESVLRRPTYYSELVGWVSDKSKATRLAAMDDVEAVCYDLLEDEDWDSYEEHMRWVGTVRYVVEEVKEGK